MYTNTKKSKKEKQIIGIGSYQNNRKMERVRLLFFFLSGNLTRRTSFGGDKDEEIWSLGVFIYRPREGLAVAPAPQIQQTMVNLRSDSLVVQLDGRDRVSVNLNGEINLTCVITG